MQLNKFKISWGQAVRENAIKNGLIAALIMTNVICAAGWFQSHETVVLVPPNLDTKASVSTSTASESYVRSWALYVAELAGNVTPGNADFVMQSMQDLLSPDAYRSIRDSLVRQITDIKSDSLTVSFSPSQIVHEKETRKIFVYGQFSSQGATGAPLKTMRTYEMQIDVRFGRPWVTSFAPYAGNPKTIAYWKTAKPESPAVSANAATPDGPASSADARSSL